MGENGSIFGVWLTVVSNRRPRQGHEKEPRILEVPKSLLKTAACNEGRVEKGEIGAGLSGREGKGKAAGGRNQNDETIDLCIDWGLVEGMAPGLEERTKVKA